MSAADVTAIDANTTARPEASTAKEELVQLLAYIREQTQEGVESGKTLVSQQAPLVAQEIVTYERARTTAGIGGGVVFLLLSMILARKAFRIQANGKDPFLHIISSILTGLPGAMLVGSLLFPSLRAWFAPRLVVLDYIRGLL